MNILYFLPDITQANGGIRQYASALLKILALDQQNKYYVLHNAKDPVILSIIDGSDNQKLIPANIGRERKIEKIARFARSIGSQIVSKANINKKIQPVSYVERICKFYNIDVVYCPYQYLPETSRKTIVTLHDVQELHFPEFFSPAERVERAQLHKTIAENSSLIVVSYKHVKEDLIKYFQRDVDSVIVCLLSMQNLWFEKFYHVNENSLTIYKLPEQFIFYPAVTWSHKNHIGLLMGLAQLRDEHGILIHVVFTGHQTDFIKKIYEAAEQLKLEQQIHFLGVVTEEVLFALYHVTQAVVVPTLYEAGSFPLMESILMGIPVICSNVTSLPETIGKSEYIFDPLNKVDMAEKIRKICFDDKFRNDNIKNSTIQANKLRNNNALIKLMSVLLQVKNM